MTTKLKIRAYAIFQFISFAAIISLLITGGLIAYVIAGDPSVSIKDGGQWAKYIKEVFIFQSDNIGILASVLAYVSIGLFLGSWISGWMVFRVENRNLFDSLFLLFLCLPIISNIFALFAQVATKEITFMSSKVDKKEIIEEQTRILILNKKKEKRKQRELDGIKRKTEEVKKTTAGKKVTVAKKIEKKTSPKKLTTNKSVVRKPIIKKAAPKKAAPKKAAPKKAAKK